MGEGVPAVETIDAHANASVAEVFRSLNASEQDQLAEAFQLIVRTIESNRSLEDRRLPH